MKALKPILFTLIAALPGQLGAQTKAVPVITTAPPPQPIMVAPPPPVMVAPRVPSDLPPATFRVEVLGGSETLWQGQLRVANYNGASFNSTINEAPEVCPADKSNLGRYAPNFSRSIRINVNRQGYAYGNQSRENAFAISASWTRPGVACEELGSSTVSFDRAFTMEAGGRAEMKGDGGLIVRLTRVK